MQLYRLKLRKALCFLCSTVTALKFLKSFIFGPVFCKWSRGPRSLYVNKGTLCHRCLLFLAAVGARNSSGPTRHRSSVKSKEVEGKCVTPITAGHGAGRPNNPETLYFPLEIDLLWMQKGVIVSHRLLLTKYHKPCGLKQQTCTLSQFWSLEVSMVLPRVWHNWETEQQKSKIRMSVGLCSIGGFG